MSGGHYKYAYEGSRRMAGLLSIQDDPRRWAFANLLEAVGKAMYEIEMVDSANKLDGEENAAVDAVLKRCLSPADFEDVRVASDAYQAQGKDR
jgi:hypothetical protein